MPWEALHIGVPNQLSCPCPATAQPNHIDSHALDHFPVIPVLSQIWSGASKTKSAKSAKRPVQAQNQENQTKSIKIRQNQENQHKISENASKSRKSAQNQQNQQNLRKISAKASRKPVSHGKLDLTGLSWEIYGILGMFSSGFDSFCVFFRVSSDFARTCSDLLGLCSDFARQKTASHPKAGQNSKMW